MRKIILSIVFILLIIGSVVFLFVRKANQETRSSRVDLYSAFEESGIPVFDLKRDENKNSKVFTQGEFAGKETISASDLKAKVIIVNFWASWCDACVEEFPSMLKLMQQLGDQALLIAISEDEKIEDMIAFAEKMGLLSGGNILVKHDVEGISAKYGINKIPETFIVDGQLKLKKKVSGSINWMSQDSQAYFKSLLN